MYLPYRVKPLKGIFPAVLGYKGGGIMVEVGEGVTSILVTGRTWKGTAFGGKRSFAIARHA